MCIRDRCCDLYSERRSKQDGNRTSGGYDLRGDGSRSKSGWLYAVSYTHLDVYKRQMYYGGDYEDLLENSKWNDPQPEEHNIMFKGRLLSLIHI